MFCVDRIIVRPCDEAYSYLDDIAKKARLLYNASLFRLRNHFTASGKTALTPNEQGVEDEVSLLPSKPGRVISAYALQRLMVLTKNP
jgi:putative transposase